jgi:nucleotide-binding universal stress UspA family protein
MDISTILHPTDGSPSAKKALDFACDLARNHDAQLILLHVQRHTGRGSVPEELEQFEKLEHVHITEADLLAEAARSIVETAQADAEAHGITNPETTIEIGEPGSTILKVATEKNADLIVIGSRGLGDLRGLLLGSVSHKVAASAPCSCVIVR